MVIKISTAFLSVPITLHNSTPSYHRAIRGSCGTTREVSCHLSLLLNIWPVWERIIIAYSEFRRLPHGSFVLCSVLLESVSTPPSLLPNSIVVHLIYLALWSFFAVSFGKYCSETQDVIEKVKIFLFTWQPFPLTFPHTLSLFPLDGHFFLLPLPGKCS